MRTAKESSFRDAALNKNRTMDNVQQANLSRNKHLHLFLDLKDLSFKRDSNKNLQTMES
jgi:hypothetical protein